MKTQDGVYTTKIPGRRFDGRGLRVGVVIAFLLGGGTLGRAQAGTAVAPRQYVQIFCRHFSLNDVSIPPDTLRSLNGARSQEAVGADGTRWRATAEGLLEIKATGSRRIWSGKDGLPVLKLSCAAAGPDGRLWLAGSQGAICLKPDELPDSRWFYFWGKRYLAENDVANIVAEDGRAWIRTSRGVSLIELKPFDLEQKSGIFADRTQQRHNRYGYVADCDLLRPGDLSSFRPAPADNDGLWTSIYVAAECFRYGVTHSPEALRNARGSLAALVLLETITGIPGFPARALIHRDDYREPQGEWHWTPDANWEWKGDTSSDELVGHFFAYAVAYDLLAGESDRRPIRAVVERIASHLLDHGMKLEGYSGRVTRWGNYSPEYFETPEGREEAPLSSLELLSHLKVAAHVTGEEKFSRAYQQAIGELGYLRNVMRFATETPGEINYSDQELAFLAFYPLVRLEENTTLRRQYQRALEGLWGRVRSERNPLWNFIYAAATAAEEYSKNAALDTLDRIPLDTISWSVKNSQRGDLELAPSRGRYGEKQSRHAIPPNERAMMKWNGNPFELDGGADGRSEDDGAFFLLPYWLGRFHGLIPP